jgi:hypothetical protein
MNTQTRQALRRGALAGMGGGMIMAMWSMIVLWLTGAGLWTPLNLIANTVWRPAPLGAAFSGGALALGLALHMMMSIGLGMAFAVAARAAGLLAVPGPVRHGRGVPSPARLARLNHVVEESRECRRPA